MFPVNLKLLTTNKLTTRDSSPSSQPSAPGHKHPQQCKNPGQQRPTKCRVRHFSDKGIKNLKKKINNKAFLRKFCGTHVVLTTFLQRTCSKPFDICACGKPFFDIWACQLCNADSTSRLSENMYSGHAALHSTCFGCSWPDLVIARGNVLVQKCFQSAFGFAFLSEIKREEKDQLTRTCPTRGVHQALGCEIRRFSQQIFKGEDPAWL